MGCTGYMVICRAVWIHPFPPIFSKKKWALRANQIHTSLISFHMGEKKLFQVVLNLLDPPCHVNRFWRSPGIVWMRPETAAGKWGCIYRQPCKHDPHLLPRGNWSDAGIRDENHTQALCKGNKHTAAYILFKRDHPHHEKGCLRACLWNPERGLKRPSFFSN